MDWFRIIFCVAVLSVWYAFTWALQPTNPPDMVITAAAYLFGWLATDAVMYYHKLYKERRRANDTRPPA